MILLQQDLDPPMIKKLSFQERLEAGQFVLTSELAPPKSASRDVVLKKAGYLKEFDAVNITDNQLAIGRMSALAVSTILIQEGLEPIVQFTLRDRNRLALQADLLGAYALGVRNIFCLTGDHPRFGNHPDAKPVFEFTVIEFLKRTKALCEKGEFFNGELIKVPPGVVPKLFLGAAANPITKGGLDGKTERHQKKIEAGARFFQTQPIFDLEGFQEWLEAIRSRGFHKKAYFLAGVMPVKSVKGIHHLAKEVPGNFVPEPIIRRMESSQNPSEEGKKICVETLTALKSMEGIHGIHFMSVAWEEALSEVAHAAGLLSPAIHAVQVKVKKAMKGRS